MTVISLTVLMGLVKEAVKGGDERGEADDAGYSDTGRLGTMQEFLRVIVH